MKISTTNIRRDIHLVSINPDTETCVVKNSDGSLETKKIKSLVIEFDD